MTPPKRRGGKPTPQPPDWPALADAIRKRTSRRDGPSLRSLARSIGVSDTIVRRWLSGGAFPSDERVQAIQEWLES